MTDADQVQQAVQQAHAHFGRLDVVLNNAGYSLVGTVEEAIEEDVRAEFDTNYFGIKVTLVEPGAYATSFGSLSR